MARSILIALVLLCVVGCKRSSDTGAAPTSVATAATDFDLRHATLIEGRGIDPLILGTTTVSQAKAVLGASAGEAILSGNGAELDAPPLRLKFANVAGATEPVLQGIVGFRKRGGFEGKTGRGIGFLASAQQMQAVYGEPQAEWVRTFESVYYYTSGVLFLGEHPSSVQGYEGPPPEPESSVITGIEVTLPFEVLEAAQRTAVGQRVVTGPPKTTLAISVF